MKKFFQNMKAKEIQRREDKGMVARTLLNDNQGMSHSTEVLVWVLGSAAVGAACYLIGKKIFPEMFTSVGEKFTEMLNQWSITTP